MKQYDIDFPEIDDDDVTYYDNHCFSCQAYIGSQDSFDNYDGLCLECELMGVYAYENYIDNPGWSLILPGWMLEC